MGHVGVIHAGSAGTKTSDGQLVAAVRDGDDAAFEQLYRRYQRRIRGFLARRVGDPARAEDLTQEVFLSALRHLRVTDAEIHFKPWLFEIARNAAIDAHRRASRAEELPVHDPAGLRPLDRVRLGEARAPDAELASKERLDHLSGAFDELPAHHSRALVMRELEGLSYREIGERMELTRPAVESTLFRARRRLSREYDELVAGRRCESARATIGLIAEGVDVGGEDLRLARHARRCSACRRRARELGVEPLPRIAALRKRVAALLPLPWLLGRRAESDRGGLPLAGSDGAAGQAGPMLLGPGAQVTAALAERAAALVAAAVIAGAGGAALAVSQSGTPSAEGSHNQAVLGALSTGGAPPGTTNPLPRPPARTTKGPLKEGGAGAKAKARGGRAKRGGDASRDRTPPGTSPGAGREAAQPRSAPGAPGLPSLPGVDTAPVAPATGLTKGLRVPGATVPTPPAAVRPDLPDLPDLPAGGDGLLGDLQQHAAQGLP